MADGTSQASPLAVALQLADDIVGELKSEASPRVPSKVVQCAINLLTLLKKAGINTIDEAATVLAASESLVERATGEK